MLKMQHFTILLTVLLLTAACGGDTPNSNDSTADSATAAEDPKSILFAEVMEVHDAVMPKMSEMNRLRRDLKALPESTPETAAAIDSLLMAEEGMWNWMRDFKTLDKFEGQPDATVLDYLNKEKVIISEVSRQMLSSIDRAQALLKAETAPAQE